MSYYKTFSFDNLVIRLMMFNEPVRRATMRVHIIAGKVDRHNSFTVDWREVNALDLFFKLNEGSCAELVEELLETSGGVP